MSRGLGKVELDVLTIFEAGELLSSAQVATRVFGCPVPSAAEYSSVCRALASLARKGLADADGTRAWGSLKAVQSQRRKKLRLQSTHSSEDRGLDAYFTPPVAVHALLSLERQHLPQHIWEPAAGAGAIVDVLRGAGYAVVASDIADYGLAGCKLIDYIAAVPPPDVEAIVTNPPFAKAEAFARKMLSEVPYVALLLRTNFLESAEREPFFAEHPFARMWVPSLRLPMMHRHGWTGPRAPSNTAHAWFVWHRSATHKNIVGHFNWKKLDFDWRKVVAGSALPH